MSRPDPASLQPFLNRLTARSVLSEEEKQAILGLPSHAVSIRAKQEFVHIKEAVPYSCMIVSGLVARVGVTGTGARQITAFHIAGDMADLNSTVRPIGIGGLVAMCETQILRVPHAAIRAVASRYPAVAEALWRDCLLDAAILMQWVVNIGRRDARARLAHILCEMAIRYGDDRQILRRFAFPVTQEQLGDAAGLTAVHVNRSLKALAREGLVRLRHGTVEIEDWDKLAKLGDFDGAYLVADTVADEKTRLLAVA